MPPETPDHLSPKQVLQLASILTLDDGSFVIGGQALNLWGERYAERTPELAIFRPFTSKDLDYYGHRAAAQKLADALGGELQVPALGDATAQSARVIAVVEGKQIEVDFLASIIGVRHPEKMAVEIVVPLQTGDGPAELAIPVMHPLHCLQSRVANVRVLRRSDSVSMRQLAASPIVLREYINEMLELGHVHEVTSTLKGLFKYLRSDEHGRRSHEIVEGCDPLTVIAHFQTDERLDERYRAFNLASMIAEINRRRAAWLARRLLR